MKQSKFQINWESTSILIVANVFERDDMLYGRTGNIVPTCCVLGAIDGISTGSLRWRPALCVLYDFLKHQLKTR